MVCSGVGVLGCNVVVCGGGGSGVVMEVDEVKMGRLAWVDQVRVFL